MFDEKVRNSFFHSDYILYKDEFRSNESDFVLKLPELNELINRGIAFYQVFMDTYRNHRASYKESKIVLGRIRGEGKPPEEVELIADSIKGLIGFRNPHRNPTT